MTKGDYQPIEDCENIIIPQKKLTWNAVKSGLCSLSVEPLGAVIVIILDMFMIMSKFYIYRHIAMERGLNITQEIATCANSTALESEVAAESSKWVLYLNLAGYGPSLVTTVMVSSWSDNVGRKLPLMVTFIGYFILVVCYLVVVTFELPVYYLLIGKTLCGFCGDFPAVMSIIFAYLSDISSVQNRTVKIAVGNALMGVGGIFGSLLAGYWMDKQGFIPPFIFLVVLSLASILHIHFFLPESKIIPEELSFGGKMRSLFSAKPFVLIKDTLLGDFWLGLKIFGMVACFFIQLTVLNGYYDIATIFETSPPFCWSSTLIGYASAVKAFALIVSMLAIQLLHPYLSDYFLAAIGIFSNMACLLFYAFSTTTAMIFTGLGLGIFKSMDSIVFRSVSSKLVGPEGYGAVFSIFGLSESISSLIGSSIFNPIYSASVAWFPGFVFIILAIFEGTLFILFSIFYLCVRKDIVKDDSAKINERQPLIAST